MLNREDINKYNTTSMEIPSGRAEGELSQTAGATAKTVGGMVWKAVKTLLCILFLSGMLVFISVATFIFSFKNSVPPNISAMKLKFSSFVYLDNPDGTSTEYTTFYSDENRVWTPLSEIPKAMEDAQIAIEDKRFFEHSGVDWKSTASAVLKLFTHTGGGGGSTLTQQLIKNLTNENQVSILRKVKEIFTALNLENGYTAEDGERKPGYSKDEILEAYLNVVNYGGQCQGVEAAANCYFDKSIGECSIAECALIAGITQNPYQFNPLIFPEESKGRAKTVLGEMVDQEKITQGEYDAAMAELQTMKFVGAELETTDVDENQDAEKWNWYIDTMFEDIAADLMEKYGWAYDYAVDQIYNSGLEIHCAMNLKMQTDIENFFLGSESMPEDPNTEIGFFMM